MILVTFFNMLWEDASENEPLSYRIPIENATAFMLPNGHFLANVNGCVGELDTCRLEALDDFHEQFLMTAYSTGNWNDTVALQQVNTLIRSMSVIYTDGEKLDMMRAENSSSSERNDQGFYEWVVWPNVPVTATECALYFCVKEIQSQMVGNKLVENATEASYQRVHSEEHSRLFGSDGIFSTLEFVANMTEDKIQDHLSLNYTSADGSTTTNYVVATNAYLPISHYLEQTLSTPWANNTKVLERIRKLIPSLKGMFNGAVVGHRGFTPNALAGIWNDFDVDLEANFESLAISMTNDLRQKGTIDALDGPSGLVQGRVRVPRTTYIIIWYWFFFHAAILSGSAIFCIATIVISRDIPVWKSHSLATMSQGPAVIDFGPEAKTLEELEKRAKSLQVALEGTIRRRRDDGPERDTWSSKEELVEISTERQATLK